jgi:hypothetical protein
LPSEAHVRHGETRLLWRGSRAAGVDEPGDQIRSDEASRKIGGDGVREIGADMDDSRCVDDTTGNAAAGTKLSAMVGLTETGVTAMNFSVDAADEVQQSAAFMLGQQSCWPSLGQAISALFLMLSVRQFAEAEAATAKMSVQASATRETRDIRLIVCAAARVVKQRGVPKNHPAEPREAKGRDCPASIYGARRVRSDAARPLGYEREHLQPLPHRQIALQRHPGLRVSVFFFDS